MRTINALLMAVALLAGTGTAHAQDITGDWQGTIKGPKDQRTILHVSRQLDGSLQLRLLLIDQPVADWGSGNLANTVSLDGPTLKFTVEGLKASFEGTLSADRNSITGTFTRDAPFIFNLVRTTRETAWRDPAPHSDQFITVDKDVRLEVLDFGGSGRPLVLLAGLGNTAHTFDLFAPRLVDRFHVYAITRRGHGASSTPASGYVADRLADDVVQVIDALKLNRPIVAGHSVAGEELSSIGTRRPEKVAGLVYLDAGYAYALSHPLCTTPRLPVPAVDSPKTVSAAIQMGTKLFTNIKPSLLAIFAAPKEGVEPANDTERGREGCTQAFQLVPNARVVRLPGATHFVFRSNEADVLREIRAFADGLKN
jgi:pimeloyl-ACP methyl ester carboxylesterase